MKKRKEQTTEQTTDLVTPRVKKPVDRARKKKIIVRSILGVILLGVVFLIVGNSIAAANALPLVYTQTASVGDVEQVISTSGNIKTEYTKVYFAEVALPVGSINVKPGDAVTRGEVLLTFDEQALQNEKRLAELELQSAQGSYSNSMQIHNENQIDLTEANINIPVLDQQILDTEAHITRLQNRINQKKSDLAYEGSLLQISLREWSDKPLSEEYENLQKLIDLNGFEQQYNEDIMDWQAELTATQETLAKYKEYRSEMRSQQSSSETGDLTAGSKSELDAVNETSDIKANQMLENLTEAEQGMIAEFSGVVSTVDVTQGATTAAGSQLLTLESTDDVVVEISVSRYDLEQLKEGQKAEISLAGNTYQGTVRKISKIAVENATGTPVVATEISIDNPDQNIFLGMEAKVQIHTAEAKGVVIVPVEAVNVDNSGEFVYTVADGLLQKSRVTTGISSDSFIEIQEGLQEGAVILTELPSDIPEGTAVTAMPMDDTVPDGGAME